MCVYVRGLLSCDDLDVCCPLYMMARHRHDFAAHSPMQSVHRQILTPFCDVPQGSEIVTSEIIIVFFFGLEYKIMTYIILKFFPKFI